MPYYTREFDDLKAAVQGAMTYSPDLTAAVLQVQTDMGADWSGLTGTAWQAEFIRRFTLYCLLTAGTQFWGCEADQNTLRISKRDTAFVSFEYLSTGKVKATLLTLDLAGWTRHV